MKSVRTGDAPFRVLFIIQKSRTLVQLVPHQRDSDIYSTMKKYEIVLLNKKTKIYSTISWLIIALNFIAFIYIGISGSARSILYPFAGAVILLVVFILQVLYNKIKIKNHFKSVFGFIIVTWLFMGFYWPAVINALLLIFYTISTRRLAVAISEEGIIYPSFPKKIVGWNDLNNLVLKDGLLTIDFKNNKLAQAEINVDDANALNEQEFNDFCRNYLKLANKTI